MKKIILFLITVLLLFPAQAALADTTLYAAAASGELALHISPDESSYVITKIPACSKLRLVETRDTWGRVVFRRKSGWINLSFTAESYSLAANNTGFDFVKNVTVSSKHGKTSLHNVPSADELLGSKVKYTVPNDTVLNVTRKTKNGWGLVTMNKKHAWVRMSDTKEYGANPETNVSEYGIYYVYALSDGGRGINLTDAPGGSGVYAVIPDCTKLTVRNKEKNFGYTSYNGLNGWINLRETASSLANAQSNAGKAVNMEYTVVSPEKNVKLYSIPSDADTDSGNVVGSVKNGEAVFILRKTDSGWGLVNYHGVYGWLSPMVIAEKEQTEKQIIQTHDPYEVYVATQKGKGLQLLTSADGNGKKCATVPETVKLTAIAGHNGYSYVSCDYAAGWVILDGNTVPDYDSAVSIKSKKGFYCRIKHETELKNLPTYSELCGSTDYYLLPLTTPLYITRVVTTGGRKWGYAEYNGTYGWVNLNCTRKTVSPVLEKLIFAAAAALIIAAAVIIHRIIKNKRKKQEAVK